MSDDESQESQDLRHLPKQTRSVETRNAIVEAAERLFAEQGYEGTTTHRIAREAGVSVGALYRYFADKEAVLKEVYRLEVTGMRARILEEFGIVEIVGKDARQLVRTGLRLAFKIYSERPALRRVLSEQARKVPELIALRRAQEVELHQAVLLIISSFPGVRLPDREVGAYLLSLFMESLIEDSVLYREGGGAFDDDRLIDNAAELIVRYLFAESA